MATKAPDVGLQRCQNLTILWFLDLAVMAKRQLQLSLFVKHNFHRNDGLHLFYIL